MKLNTELESNNFRCCLAETCAAIVSAMHTRLQLRALYRAGLATDEVVYNREPINDEVRDVRRVVAGIADPCERADFVRLIRHYFRERSAGKARTARAYVAAVRSYQQKAA